MNIEWNNWSVLIKNKAEESWNILYLFMYNLFGLKKIKLTASVALESSSLQNGTGTS